MANSDAVATLKARALALLPDMIGTANAEAIAFQGGLGRGQADERSDIDVLLAFASEADAAGALKGHMRLHDQTCTIWHLHLDRVAPGKWTDKQRYIYAYETTILSDLCGRLSTLCHAAHLTPQEQMERVTHWMLKIGERGIAYRGMQDIEWRGRYWGDSPDLWIRRGDPYAAHMRLNEVLEFLANLLFSINGQPVPSPKWKHHLVESLPWIPADLGQWLRSLALIHHFGFEEFDRRREVATLCLTQCIDEAVRRDLVPLDIQAFYSSCVVEHVDDTST